MTKAPSPKYDQLRAMREANFARDNAQVKRSTKELRETVAAIPARKPKKAKRRISDG